MTVVAVPGSKSVTARALFLAAAAEGTTVLRRPLLSDDTDGFAEGLTRLGYSVERAAGEWRITGRPSGPAVTEADVYARDAATAARFLPALAAMRPRRLPLRRLPPDAPPPGRPLTQALRTLGVDLTHEEADGHLPLRIVADGIKGGAIDLDASLSSQFLTALLLAGPLMTEGLRIRVTGIVSVPYVEITLAMMRRFGVDVGRDGDTFVVPAAWLPRRRLPDRARRLHGQLLLRRRRAERPQRDRARPRRRRPPGRPPFRGRAAPDGRRRRDRPRRHHRHRHRPPARPHRQHAGHLGHDAHARGDRPLRRRPGPDRGRLQHPGQGVRPARSVRRQPAAGRASGSRPAATGSRSTRARPRPSRSPATATTGSR